ncbi:MAG TPA: hypothetical protein VG796_21335 [Verrucomicrobiales bacterium]|nr:hypothetical protein [Verrucomicrobiales bacterium]
MKRPTLYFCLALPLFLFGTVVIVLWNREARTVGRGFIPANPAPFAKGAQMLSGTLSGRTAGSAHAAPAGIESDASGKACEVFPAGKAFDSPL